MNSLAVVERAIAPVVTSEQESLIKRTVAKDATPDELKLYFYDCQRQGVHPLDKLIFFTKRSGKYTPITSIDFMRTRAADSGDYAGSDDAVFVGQAGKAEFAASVTVWRMVQGVRCSFTSTARWSEYKPGENDFMWSKMPHTMLAKCAEALALRKGFPRQLAGLYAKEELDQASNGTRSGVEELEDSRAEAPARRPVAAAAAGVGSTPTPATTIDVETGEEVPPPGYYYGTNYKFSNGWHDFDLLNWAEDGASLRVSTKKDIGFTAEQAINDHKPMQVKSKPKPNGRPREHYLDSVTVYQSEKPAPVMPPWDRDDPRPF